MNPFPSRFPEVNEFRKLLKCKGARGKVYVLRVMTHREYDKGNQQSKRNL